MSWRRGSKGARDLSQAREQESWQGDAWEYLVEDGDFTAERQERRCNQLGAEGWELVAVLPVSRPSLTDGGRTTAIQLFFKRPLS
jgi:hypothetical protein